MNQQAEDAITGMLNCFPQTNQNYSVLLATLEKLLAGMTSQAIIEAAERFASGDVEGQSKTFAPAAPEFITEVRKRQDYLDLKARPRIARPEYRPGLMAPFETARMKALNANAHLPVLHEDISYDQFRKLSAGKELPVGSKWVAATGTVYGPEPTANRKVA